MQIMIGGFDVSNRYAWKTVQTEDTDGNELDVCELQANDALAAQEFTQAGQDELIMATEAGYSTGPMYVDTVRHLNGDTTLLARSIPSKGREKAWASYENVTLMELVSLAAREMGMGFARYGITDQKYDRVIRREETQAEFLRRLLRREGAVLKAVGGKLTAIDLIWAQQQKAVLTMNIEADTPGCLYQEAYAGYRACRVTGILAEGIATDTAVPGNRTMQPKDIMPENGRQAKRWAAGELLHKNRESSMLVIDGDYMPELAAMSRVDITGMSVTAGEWIARKVRQDMKEKKTRLHLCRCIKTIV